ncbi:hypothetical protein CCACVL1_15924 [Corchorus capsularis]|uniref:Uncharacterized protein n=1 Tax=Corchorus capsularis TaxID=210143 RepID=A0A1R3I0I3_COCAP|nr:hypothetical protein CCACVL1_15924 [Corchorus capsularis]
MGFRGLRDCGKFCNATKEENRR